MSEKPTSNKDKTVHVSETCHSAVKKYLEEEGVGSDIGKFYEKAAMMELARRKKHPPFEKLNSNFLIDNGWEKVGSSSYKKENDTIRFNGVIWYWNGLVITEENYIELIKPNTKP